MKEIFNYKEYIDFMESKLKRRGKYRTFTNADYFTDEQMKEFYKLGVSNLEIYLPTPKYIREHINFAYKTHNELLKKFPNDEFLHSLDEKENIHIKISTNWYETYGIKYYGLEE